MLESSSLSVLALSVVLLSSRILLQTSQAPTTPTLLRQTCTLSDASYHRSRSCTICNTQSSRSPKPQSPRQYLQVASLYRECLVDSSHEACRVISSLHGVHEGFAGPGTSRKGERRDETHESTCAAKPCNFHGSACFSFDVWPAIHNHSVHFCCDWGYGPAMDSDRSRLLLMTNYSPPYIRCLRFSVTWQHCHSTASCLFVILTSQSNRIFKHYLGFSANLGLGLCT